MKIRGWPGGPFSTGTGRCAHVDVAKLRLADHLPKQAVASRVWRLAVPPDRDEPDDVPDSLPVAPDEGPVPAVIPEDPEQQRVVQPED